MCGGGLSWSNGVVLGGVWENGNGMEWYDATAAEAAAAAASAAPDISFISIILIKLKKNIQGSATEAATWGVGGGGDSDSGRHRGEMKSGKCENAKYAAM